MRVVQRGQGPAAQGRRDSHTSAGTNRIGAVVSAQNCLTRFRSSVFGKRRRRWISGATRFRPEALAKSLALVLLIGFHVISSGRRDFQFCQ